MTLLLRELHPDREFEYVYTPTGDELPAMQIFWVELGQILGKPLIPITCGETLTSLIVKQNAIPNFRMRWCTRMLKLEPFIAYALSNLPATLYVGLRADEDLRDGAVYGKVEGITQSYPLQDNGFTLAKVWDILGRYGIEIPERTDCALCFFQRLAEWWRLWAFNRDRFNLGVALEKLTGHTFRTPGRDTWPVSLEDLGKRFEAGDIPKGAAQIQLISDRPQMCRACSL